LANVAGDGPNSRDFVLGAGVIQAARSFMRFGIWVCQFDALILLSALAEAS
jgi:hypothetical protein